TSCGQVEGRAGRGWRSARPARFPEFDSTPRVAATIFQTMLRIVGLRSMFDERPPVGAAVRLRIEPEVTGVVVGDTFECDRVRVRWDDTDIISDSIAAKLELVR